MNRADYSSDVCIAAAQGDTDTVRHLVKNGFDVNAGDYDQRTPIHLAASEGRFSVVRCLVDELSADMNVQDRWGGTPLDDALRSGHKQVSSYLVSKGAFRGRTASFADDASIICQAASKGDLDCIRGLLRRNVDVDLGDYDKRTAIHLAASEGNLRVVKCLIDEMGADPNVKDRWGGTPLDDAVRSGHQALYKYLKGKGGMPGKTASVRSEDATDLCDAAFKGDVERLRKLAQQGVNADSGDYDKRTAMHLAASEGWLLVVKCLVEELKADKNAIDRWGGTPLDDAIRSGHEAVSSYLESHGALQGKVARFADEGSLLCDAGARGDGRCLRGLAKQGIDVNACNADGRTALHLAAAGGHLDIVKCLIEELHAKPHAKDCWGFTPLNDARRFQHSDVVEYLTTAKFCSEGSEASEPKTPRAWRKWKRAMSKILSPSEDDSMKEADDSMKEADGRFSRGLAHWLLGSFCCKENPGQRAPDAEGEAKWDAVT
mmetsp:Transcript_75699/g.167661  ORF Transcript_75699/g.167661 Transcript_75699/m.167661 type:complete len:489 (-) Transcript_75699:117-1583(-)